MHLAFLVDPSRRRRREHAINVGGTEHFLDACAAVDVQTVVVASSATVYGAAPDNSPGLREDAPLRGKPGFPYVEDKLRVEQLTTAFGVAHPSCRVLIVRPSLVVGPGMSNYISRYLSRRLVALALDHDPPLPVVHEDDASGAVHTLLTKERPGPTT